MEILLLLLKLQLELFMTIKRLFWCERRVMGNDRFNNHLIYNDEGLLKLLLQSGLLQRGKI
jgi:hypothetical protein